MFVTIIAATIINRTSEGHNDDSMKANDSYQKSQESL